MADPLTIALFAVSTGISLLAARSAAKKKDETLLGDIPATEAERGSYIPLIIGRDQLGGVLLAETTRRLVEEDTGQTGGKGLGAGGAGNGSMVVYSRVFMGICVGPARRLRSIEMNGEQVWPLGDSFQAGITPDTHPSGSRLAMGGEPSAGSFVIYWGEGDQPFNNRMLLNDGFSVQSRFPYLCYVYFDELRLGSQGLVPSLIFDIEAAPYKSTYSLGASYLALPFDLEGSNGWFRNAKTTDDLNTFSVLRYNDTAGTIKVAGNAAGSLTAGEEFLFRYGNQPGIIARSTGASYNPSEGISIPGGVTLPISGITPRLVNTAQVSPHWVPSGPLTLTRLFSPWNIPGIPNGSALSLNDIGVYRLTSTAAFTLRFIPSDAGVTPPGASSYLDAGNGRNQVRLYVKGQVVPGSTSVTVQLLATKQANTTVGTALTGHSAFIRFSGDRVVTLGDNNDNAISTALEEVGDGWYLCLVNVDTWLSSIFSPTDDLRFVLSCSVAFQFEMAYGAGNKPWLIEPLLTYRDVQNIVGVTTVSTDLELAGYQDFVGTLGALVLDPEKGDHGANAAHTIHQLLFESWPHGLGRDKTAFDLGSLVALGVAMESEGLRTHVKVDSGDTISSALGTLMAETGISFVWDHTTGLWAFRLERADTPDAAVPYHSIIQEPLGTTRVFDAGSADLLAYEFVSAADNYATYSVDVDRQGAQSLSAGGSVSTTRLKSSRDVETGQRLARIIANLDFSQASAKSFRMGRDGITNRSGDLLDFTSWTRTPQFWRVQSVAGSTHTPEVEVTAFEDRLDYGQPSLVGLSLLREQTGGPEPEPDLAVWAFETDGSLYTARLPAHPDMAFAEVLGSNEGSTFWRLGVIGYVAGGILAFDSGTEIWVRSRDSDAMARLLRIPAAAEESEVLRGTTTTERGWAFQGLEDLGRGLWRLYGLPEGRTPIDVEAGPLQFVFLWVDGTLPRVTGALPTSDTRTYRVESRQKQAEVAIRTVDTVITDVIAVDGNR